MDDGPPKSAWKHDRPFRLGELEVRPASGEIEGWAGTQRLRPLLMDLLLRLAAEPGAVVKRETLLEEVWPRRMVNDEVLSRAMAELRAALGDDVKDARYVETLPKIGYRLLAPVTEVAPPRQQPAAVAAPVARPARGGVVAAGMLGIVAVIAIAAWVATARKPVDASALERRLAAARPFTSDPGAEVGPRFSPRGDRVAYAVTTSSGGARIVVRGVDGREHAAIGGDDRVTRVSPVFFPDGNRLAFWRAEGEACGIVEWSLGKAAQARVLVDCDARPRPRFDLSADGRWLVYSAATRPQWPAGLQLVDLQAGTRSVLTAPEPGAGDDLFPRFSPDGRRVAFFRGNESHRSVWMVARDDPPGVKRVSKLDGLGYGVAWVGREGPLLVAADWLGFRALNVMDAATGEARLAGARGARFPDVHGDGAVVWENAMYAANLHRLAPDGQSAAPLWPSTRYTNQPEFSPDGRRLAFSSNRDGTDALYVAALDGAPRRIAGDARRRFLRPHWSADGAFVHAVRFTLQDDGSSVQEGVRIAAGGGSLEVLGALGTAVNDVRESADGRWLYWAESTGHAMRLLRAPVDRLAQSERLPWPVVSQYQMNRDAIVFAQPQLTRLTRCRLADLACEPLPIEVAPAALYHWTLGPRSLLVAARDGVARYDAATGKALGMLAAAPSGGGTSLALSPDERELVYVKEEGPAIDLVIAPP